MQRQKAFEIMVGSFLCVYGCAFDMFCYRRLNKALDKAPDKALDKALIKH